MGSLMEAYAQKRAYDLFHGVETNYTLNDYKLLVSTVCSYLADLNKVLDDSDKGIEPDREYVQDTCRALDNSKELLLKVKEQLHLWGGLSAFEDSFNLFGAEFRNGRFKIHKGHEESYKKETLTAATTFIQNFPGKSTPYNFEAMSMALFFCYPLVDNNVSDVSNNKSNRVLSFIGQIFRRYK